MQPPLQDPQRVPAPWPPWWALDRSVGSLVSVPQLLSPVDLHMVGWARAWGVEVGLLSQPVAGFVLELCSSADSQCCHLLARATSVLPLPHLGLGHLNFAHFGPAP